MYTVKNDANVIYVFVICRLCKEEICCTLNSEDQELPILTSPFYRQENVAKSNKL